MTNDKNELTIAQVKALLAKMKERGWYRVGRGIYGYTLRNKKEIVYDLRTIAGDGRPAWQPLAQLGMTPPPF